MRHGLDDLNENLAKRHGLDDLNEQRTKEQVMKEQVNKELVMFDVTVKEMTDLIARKVKTPADGGRMVMSMLSDVQDMMAIGMDQETIRRTLNRAKFILEETVIAKEEA